MSELNIHQRILLVMRGLRYVQKEKKTVNGQYTFVSHDSVVGAVRPHLIEAGITMVPTVKHWEQSGDRTQATVSVDFVNADKPDDKITVEAFGFGVDKQDKGPGKAVSYACKYAILKTFALETGDDPERDSIDHHEEKEGGEPPKSKMDEVKQAAERTASGGGARDLTGDPKKVLDQCLEDICGNNPEKRKTKLMLWGRNAGLSPDTLNALKGLDDLTHDEAIFIVEKNKGSLAVEKNKESLAIPF